MEKVDLKVKCIHNDDDALSDLIIDKVYDVISVEDLGWYRIIDESGEDYMYPPGCFEVTKG